MKQHFGDRAPHRLTPYVEVLQTRVNKVNKAAVCKACINKLGREIALERSIFTNTKACAKAHFKKCQSFFEKYNEEERAESTISSRFAFRWTEDSEIVVLFKFLNPNLKLPGRRALSGRILTLYSEELQRQHIVEAKKHEIGNTLIFD
ncbi:27324_t:CDS:2, partial [Gigaspora margarita]